MEQRQDIQAQIRLGRAALARQAVHGPTLTRMLLQHRASGAPLRKLLVDGGHLDARAVGELEAQAGGEDPTPPAKPVKVERVIHGVRCDVQLETDALTTLFVGKRPRDPKPVCVLLIERDALQKGLWMDFLETVRAAQHVESPDVEEILDVARTDEGFVVVTRYHQGAINLRSLLDRVGRLKLSEALRIGGGIARGVAALHGAGLTHRHVGPESIGMTRDGKVLVRSPGIAFEPPGVEAFASPRTVFGRPHYMAPEAWRGDPPNPMTDVYAVGAILHEMATGVRPFEGELGDLREQHLESPPVRPDEVLVDLPRNVSDLLVWALNKDPHERPTAEKAANIIRTLEGSIQRTGSTQRFEAHGG